MHDLRVFIQEIQSIVARHNLGTPGEYTRWLTQDAKGSRNLGSTPYGCANAVNILYTIGALPEGEDRQAMADVLRRFQDKESGLFVSPGNYETHTTAFVSGALKLLDVKPLHRAKAFGKYLPRMPFGPSWTPLTGPATPGWVPTWAQACTPRCC